MLGVSDSQSKKFVREGRIHPIRIPGLRVTAFDMDEVYALAEHWIREARSAREQRAEGLQTA